MLVKSRREKHKQTELTTWCHDLDPAWNTPALSSRLPRVTLFNLIQNQVCLPLDAHHRQAFCEFGPIQQPWSSRVSLTFTLPLCDYPTRTISKRTALLIMQFTFISFCHLWLGLVCNVVLNGRPKDVWPKCLKGSLGIRKDEKKRLNSTPFICH